MNFIYAVNFSMIYSSLSKIFSMNKLFALIVSFIFIACNNPSTKVDSKDMTSKNNIPHTATNWTREDELEFTAGCVDHVKVGLGEEKAYAYCKCVLDQVKTKYAMDSTIVEKLSDTAEIAKMALNCK